MFRQNNMRDCGALGLDQPLWERFGHWFWRLLRWRHGYSMLFNMPVASVIRERLRRHSGMLAGAGYCLVCWA